MLDTHIEPEEQGRFAGKARPIQQHVEVISSKSLGCYQLSEEALRALAWILLVVDSSSFRFLG